MKSRGRVVSFSVGLVVLFGGLLISPAQATVTSSLSAKPDAYTGTCPTDITFNGTIYLSNTGTLQYRFVRSDGSTNPTSGKLSHYYPAAGTFKVADIWYQVNSNGNDKLEVYYNNTIFLQSAIAPFTVACVQAGGPSAGKGRFSVTRVRTSAAFKMAPLIIGLVPPTSLRSTNDPQLCAQHLPIPLFAGAVCAGAISAGKLILVWDWASSCPSGKTCSPADGYRVYPSRTNVSTPVAITTTNGSAATMTAIDPKASSSGCYAVTAFKGDVESDTSIDYCAGGAAIGSRTQSLAPNQQRSVFRDDRQRTGICNSTSPSLVPYGDLEAGFRYYTVEDTFCDYAYSRWGRAAMHFDLSQIQGKAVWKATLRIPVLSTREAPKTAKLSSVIFTLTNYSCASEIGTGVGDWWSNQDWIEADFYDRLPTQVSALEVDVTSQVKLWAQNEPNYGFVLKGETEGDHFLNYECATYYGTPSLTVEYFE